jgi:hypothetical protein
VLPAGGGTGTGHATMCVTFLPAVSVNPLGGCFVATHGSELGDPYQRLDTTTVSSARRWNYWLGGKDNFAVDRESGDRIAQAYPAIRTAAREGRAFHRRAITYLAEHEGIRQFLDIGTGLPAPDNTHEVAQAVDPSARVVYVDNDPMVLAHFRALTMSASEGAIA